LYGTILGESVHYGIMTDNSISYFGSDDSSPESLPFYKEFAKGFEINPGDRYEIIEIWETKKGGLLLKTDIFMEHYFQRSRLFAPLTEALREYVKAKGKGYKLFFEVQEDVRKSPMLAADFSQPRVWTFDSGKYAHKDAGGYSPTDSAPNPFLPQPSPTKLSSKGARA